jgi:virulence factor Mce-like protein
MTAANARPVRRARPSRLAALLAGLVTALSGCAVSAVDIPLPSGGVDGPSYRLNAVFADALNLPEGAHVKLDGDDVGRVQDIRAVDYTARVSMAVRRDVTLPRGTTAELRQATPLGEVFVALHPPGQPGQPASPSAPPLRDGDTIALPDTEAAASVEDLLASLSMLVNGGGLAQLQTIVHELNAATTGRADQIAHLLGQTNQTLGTLNARTADIDRVLAASQRLTDTLVRRRGTVDAAFSDLTPAIRVLADQTDRFTRALNTARKLSDTGDDLIDDTGPDIRGLARDLGPVLDGFARIGPDLAPSLRTIVSLGRTAESVGKGESFAGDASVGLLPLIAVPQPGDRLPGPDDFVGGEQSFAEHLQHQFSTLGGIR